MLEQASGKTDSSRHRTNIWESRPQTQINGNPRPIPRPDAALHPQLGGRNSLRAWGRCTRGRFECTHGGRFERAPPPSPLPSHTTPHTHHDTQQHSTEHACQCGQPCRSRQRTNSTIEPNQLLHLFLRQFWTKSVMMFNNERFARQYRHDPPRKCALVKKSSPSFGS